MCGHENEAYASECAKCYVNLKWALDNVTGMRREAEARKEKTKHAKAEGTRAGSVMLILFLAFLGALGGCFFGYYVPVVILDSPGPCLGIPCGGEYIFLGLCAGASGAIVVPGTLFAIRGIRADLKRRARLAAEQEPDPDQ
jgi:hypothetical protein